MLNLFPPITTAELDWQDADGVDVPVSKVFGDVYFSKENGLLETRHVFLNGNDLSERLAQLEDQQVFTVGETGFGTGLNFLALWQLWQQVRPSNRSHLHFVTVEKFPLSLKDLKRALQVWNELTPLSQQLIEQYPLPLAGCHRLSFPDERISIDLWFGDAAQCFPLIKSPQPFNAWFLDGFAPSCNPELWETQIFQNIMRLSDIGTSFASFSVAGILKRALREYGVSITRPKGFGHKREMLKAIWETKPEIDHTESFISTNQFQTPKHIAIVGAGIAGLVCAWKLAEHGIAVTLYDQSNALSGGSGNPLAMLNPKLCPIEQVATHLMTTSWQYALRFYHPFKAFKPIKIHQILEKNIEEAKSLAQSYPSGILSWQPLEQNNQSILLNDAGTICPHQLADEVLAHPLIQFQTTKITSIKQIDDQTIVLIDENQHSDHASHVILCNALALNELVPNSPPLKPIRGQVTWAKVNRPIAQEQQMTGYSYGGYAMPLDENHLIFGASFLPKKINTDVCLEEHQHNFGLLQQNLPHFAENLTTSDTWQGRSAIRAQTNDYLPLVGKLTGSTNLYCLAGLGSKGFLFAPLCSEIITSQILGKTSPVPSILENMLSPLRFQKKVKIKKPYYQSP